MEKPTLVKVENNCSAPVLAPPTPSYPHGQVWKPSEMKSIPQEYIDELCARKVKKVDADGNVIGERFPGKEEWTRLTTETYRLTVVKNNNIQEIFSTYLTVYSADQAPREDGIDLPVSLITYNASAAKAIIQSTTNVQRLELWAKDRHKDKSVLDAAKARLAELKS